ncbi:hypothetical protein NDA16_000796 [Ustilago loliicola]|nr:hypothetical protein NDA16_000796 [Ustilago loliicola]
MNRNDDDSTSISAPLSGAVEEHDCANISALEAFVTEWLHSNQEAGRILLKAAARILEDLEYPSDDPTDILKGLWNKVDFDTLVSHVARNAHVLDQGHALASNLSMKQRCDPLPVLQTLRSEYSRLMQCQDLNRRQIITLQLILQISYHNPSTSRQHDESTRSADPADDFTATFNGNGLDLLIDHIVAHNSLFPKPSSPRPRVHATGVDRSDSSAIVGLGCEEKKREYYAKVLPILQSSGFGKTRLCVQLGTVRPGMLVCLRNQPPNDKDYQTSYPKQDECVYVYFKQVQALLKKMTQSHVQHNPRPANPQDHELFNRAHLNVLAWLATYCKTMARYLDQLQAASGCFHPTTNTADAPLAVTPAHRDPEACWRSVVFHLANASSFKKGFFFDEPTNLCDQSNLKALFSAKKPRARNPLAVPPDMHHKDYPPPPQLVGMQDLRTDILQYICATATALVQTIKTELADKLSEPELLTSAIRFHLSPHLTELERIVQAAGEDQFAFVALDECGSMPEVLPIIRRVWFHAMPLSTWILLIDTNSDLAPLAGTTAQDGSRRLGDFDLNILTEPFSSLPLDVNLTDQDRQALLSHEPQLTLRQVNQKVPKTGRPLWNDTKYQSNGIIRPIAILKKLIWPTAWTWPGTLSAVPRSPIHDTNQNLLALASRRLHLALTSKSSPQHWYTFVSRQIEHHLRFVGRISSTSDSIKSCVQSEPPLDAAAAWYFRCEPDTAAMKWVLVVRAIVTAGEPVGLNVGASGELGVALLCTAAADVAVSDRHRQALRDSNDSAAATDDQRYKAVFGLISVDEWLRMLAGSRYDDTTHDAAAASTGAASSSERVKDGDQDMPDWQEQGLKPKTETLPPLLAAWANRAWINFKHPVVLRNQVPHKKRINLDLLAELWFRHAAAQGVSNQAGWDLIIPVYVSDTDEPPSDDDLFDISRLSYIAIQVKNRIGSPSDDEKSAPVGPRLAFSQETTKECLEIFFDIKGTTSFQGHIYSQRRHPDPELRRRQQKKRKLAELKLTAAQVQAKEEAQAREDEIDRRLLRHHIMISGMHDEFLPILQALINLGDKQIRLLFGDADSLDALKFDQELTSHVRRSNSREHQRSWDAAHARADGQVVLFQESLRSSPTPPADLE